MRATFKDLGLQAQLERDGYAVVPLLDESEVDALRASFDELGPAPGDPHLACHSSFHSFDADYKVAVDHTVRAALSPHLERVLDRQRMLPCNFIVKWPSGMSGFGLHQDLSLVDESEHRSVEVWVALDETTELNGQLWVVPGSHRWLPGNIRGIKSFPFPFGSVTQRIIERHARPVPLQPGEAIVFNHATLHFSMPNRSEQPRLVAIADLIPEEATHVHYFGAGEGNVQTYEIDDRFWTANNPFTLGKPPVDARELGPATTPYRELIDEDLDRLVAEGWAIESDRNPRGAINAAKPWCHRCGATDLPLDKPNRSIGNVTLLCGPCSDAETERVLAASSASQ
jgi:hypothetical protein